MMQCPGNKHQNTGEVAFSDGEEKRDQGKIVKDGRTFGY